MNQRTTKILVMLLALAIASAALAFAQLNKASRLATSYARELQLARVDLADMARARGDGALSVLPTSGADPELNRRLHSAAVAADVGDNLRSIEPGQPTRVRNTAFLETPVFIRLDATTLRQVVTFLSRLSSSDRAIRVKTIELSPPEPSAHPASQPPAERWTTDLTVAYLVHSPDHQP